MVFIRHRQKVSSRTFVAPCHENVGGVRTTVIAVIAVIVVVVAVRSDMLKLLSDLKEFVKRPPVTIDGTVFRVHVTFTTVVLLVCSIMVTATQYVGTPIQCIVVGLPTKPVNSYCWITSTFTMPDAFQREQGVGSAHPGVGPETAGEPPKYYTYYQWVCFALFFQGMLCYFPKWLWDMQEGGLMGTLVMGLHFGLGAEKEKEKQKKILVQYMLTHIRVSGGS